MLSWLEMPVEGDDGKGGRRRTNRARTERKGTPQGAPISPLISNVYTRRFILGWKVLGHARRYRSEIVNYADDLCVLGKAPAAEMLAGVERVMDRLRLPINERKTRCLRCPEEPMDPRLQEALHKASGRLTPRFLVLPRQRPYSDVTIRCPPSPAKTSASTES